jgi:predicted CoA-binding protein
MSPLSSIRWFLILPVPVYYPRVTHILGQKVYRKLIEIPLEVGLVNIFRRSQDVSAHLDDILAKNRSPCGLPLHTVIFDSIALVYGALHCA